MELPNTSSYLLKTEDVSMFDSLIPKGETIINSTNDINTAKQILESDGVVKIPNVMNLEELKNIAQYARENTYTGDVYDTVIIDKHKHILFSPDRQDMWNIDLPLTMPKIITDLMARSLKAEYKKSSTGVLTLDPNQFEFYKPKWHRDILPLFKVGNYYENDYYTIHNIPDFYFTVFIPLTPCTKESGATEMLIGSHKSDNGKLAIAEGSPGDVIVMNGKTIHRGAVNKSFDDRDVLYVIYCAKWYDEEKY